MFLAPTPRVSEPTHAPKLLCLTLTLCAFLQTSQPQTVSSKPREYLKKHNKTDIEPDPRCLCFVVRGVMRSDAFMR